MKNHLKETGESYWKHGYFAFKWGLFLILTGLISIVHGIFPFLWPFEAPRRVLIVAKVVKVKHPEMVLFLVAGNLTLPIHFLLPNYII